MLGAMFTNEGKRFKKTDNLLENRKLLFEGVGNLLSPASVHQKSGKEKKECWALKG